MDFLTHSLCQKLACDLFSQLDKAKNQTEEDCEQYKNDLDQFYEELSNKIENKLLQNKKKPKTQALAEVTNTEIRPTRTAAKKVSSMKEKPLNTKMRNNDGVVKVERSSTLSNIENIPQSSSSIVLPATAATSTKPLEKIKKEKSLEKNKSVTTNSSMLDEIGKRKSADESQQSQSDSRKKVDESVQILPGKSLSLIELSDDEANVFVAPKPPTKKTARQRKLNKESNIESDDGSLSTMTVDVAPVKLERTSRVTRSKKKNIQSEVIVKKGKSIEDKKKTNSMESIYEDALPTVPPSRKQSNEQNLYNSIVVLEKLNEADLPVTEKAPPVARNQPNDATFLAPVNTYVVVKDQMASNSNETFNVGVGANCTVVIEKCPAPAPKENSLLTDDDSIEIPPRLPLKAFNKPQSKKELFDPCVGSPLKKKIAAFEKHATEVMQSPRLTRTKTRQRQENEDPKVTKPSTPSVEPRNAKFTTPTIGSSLSTPNLFQSGGKKPTTVGSAAKLAHLKRNASATKIPRDLSLDDKRRGITVLVDEKKKRHDEKMRQVQQTREAIEREKLEKYRKMVQEKEEKQQEVARKKKEEIAQKKILEDMNKNLRIAEQKREQQKKTERELLEAARKERENTENLRIVAEKNALQAKLKQNELNYQMKKKNEPSTNYKFDNICSDDSTDNESEVCSKKGRAPVWSLATNRGPTIVQQSYLNPKVTDALFSVQPMTPNLQEIFPKIDPRNLKRNSSAVWNTPPRYSQLPKY